MADVGKARHRAVLDAGRYFDEQPWTPLAGQALQDRVKALNFIDGRYETTPQTTQVAWLGLPFYARARLVQVRDPAWHPRNLRVYYLELDGALYRLKGTSSPIHEVNDLAPITLTEANVLDYLRFFCFFVREDEGPFLLVEAPGHLGLPSVMDGQTRVVLEETVRPPRCECRNEQDGFLCDGLVLYADTLFITRFAVHRGGMVEMIDDQLVASALPIQVDAPID